MNISDNWPELSKEFLYSEREVIISDTILGKGAFGEVRIGKWRNIQIAVKKLHSLIVEQENDIDRLQFQSTELVDTFIQEMITLSKLRHPNLVLFLGVGFNPRNRQPTLILTELLSQSLYDIIETQKIKLTLPEILDISLDVISGLEYLHSSTPQIVHRDISSKNILLGGKHAKIADLGQAKVFGSTALSRQTTMPGAMAYSAPEVLTGRYTSKIDIFSFGVLLIQMCCGEYPRIDRRDEQQRLAIQKYEPFDGLLKSTIAYQPNDRPTAAEISETLKEIRGNDRYYPPLRHLPPQSEIGILARKWMEETVEERCGDIRIALEQTARRVTVEEQRWRDEAGRVDKVLKELKEMTTKYTSCQEIIDKKDYEIQQLQLQLQLLRQENQQKTLENQSLLTEKDNLNHLLSNSLKKSNDLEVMMNISRREVETLRQEKDDLTNQCNKAKDSEYSSKSNENHVKFQLEMQVEHCRDLEGRLEQTLLRWKHEKEQVNEETKRCTRLRETCSELVEKDFRRKEEIDRLTSRLNMYNSLPLPDEIKARFRDNDADIERLTNLSEELRHHKYQTELKYQELKTVYENSVNECEEAKKNYQQIVKQMSVKDERIHHLEEMVNELDEQVQHKVENISRLENDKKNLIGITETIRDELQSAKDEVHAANVARRRAELDMSKNKGGGGGGGSDGKHDKSSSRRKRYHRNNHPSGSSSPSKNNNNEKEKEKEDDQSKSSNESEDDAENENGNEDDDDEESDGGDIFDSNPSPSPSSKLNHPAELEEIFDVDTRKKILNDQEKLRRYSINTRLKKVKDGELGMAESNAIKENTATRFHVYGSNNFNDLVKSATSTKDHLSKLHESQHIGDQEDFAERQRERDNAAKLKITMAIERGGIDKIIECLWENLDCEHTIWRGARAIRELFIKDDIVKQHCIEAKCEEILIAGLTAFPAVSLVQTQCLRALAALVFGSDIVRRHCGEKGALRRIVIALQLHTKDENVVIQACTALTNLCHNSSDNRGRYLEAGGTEPLLVAMTAHLETSVKVQRQACWAILTLAGSDEISRLILGQGADKCLLKSMMQWKNDSSLQQFACWAISNLALSDEENKLKLKHSGILEMCHIALEVHENNMEVVRQARHTISVLGSVPLNDESNLTRPRSKRKPTILKPMKRDTSFTKK